MIHGAGMLRVRSTRTTKPRIRRPAAISPTVSADDAGRTFASDGALDATEPSAGKARLLYRTTARDCGVVSGSRERRSRSASTISSTSSRNETRGSQPSSLRAREASPTRSIDLGRSHELLVAHDVAAPSRRPACPKAISHELAHRVLLAGRDHVVLRLVLLQHQPHRPHVVAGVAPVALRRRGCRAAARRRGRA